MPISFRVETEGRIADIEAMAPERVAERLRLRIERPVQQFLMNALSQPAPPRTDIKFVWSFNKAANTRARRWWFWALSQGKISTDGKHYKRTGDMAERFHISVTRQGNVITIDASNPAPGSEHVYGSETQQQIPGHKTTGWIDVQDLILSALEFVEDTLEEELDREMTRILKV